MGFAKGQFELSTRELNSQNLMLICCINDNYQILKKYHIKMDIKKDVLNSFYGYSSIYTNQYYSKNRIFKAKINIWIDL